MASPPMYGADSPRTAIIRGAVVGQLLPFVHGRVRLIARSEAADFDGQAEGQVIAKSRVPIAGALAEGEHRSRPVRTTTSVCIPFAIAK